MINFNCNNLCVMQSIFYNFAKIRKNQMQRCVAEKEIKVNELI